MAFDFETRTIEELTAERSRKWSAFPGTIGMWVAEMDFGISPEIRDYLISEAHRGSLGYLPPHESDAILNATSQWLSRFGWAPDTRRMMLLPEVLAGLRITIEHYSTPGSPVIVPTPAYMPFLTIPGEFDREVIEVPSVRDDDGVWHMDLEGIEAGFQRGAEVVVLCNPWNPTGRCLTHEELTALDTLVTKYNGRVFEDAIHVPLILDGTYIPYATVSDEAPNHTITAVAASKGWNIPGLKCAQLIFNNDADWEAFKPHAHAATEPTSTVGARAAGVCFTTSQEWNDGVRDYLRGNRDLLQARVAEWDGVSMAPVEGTYITLLDFSELAQRGVFGGKNPATFLREKAEVALTPGSACGSDYTDFARMIFATPRHILVEALDRIERALYSSSK